MRDKLPLTIEFDEHEIGDWMRFKAAENLRSMGYKVAHEYTLATGGRVDLRGHRGNEGGYEFVYIELKRNRTIHDIMHGVGQLLYYRMFDPYALLILAIPEGDNKFSDTIYTFMERHGIKLWQLAPPEHPIGGPEFLGATIKE